MDEFWNLFEKSGSIDAYLTYKEIQRQYDTNGKGKTLSSKDKKQSTFFFDK